MTIALTGAGSLGVRLGHLIQAFNDVNALRGGNLTQDGRATDVSASMTTKLNTVEADLAAGTAQYALADGLQSAYGSFQSAQSGFLSYLRTLAQSIVIKMADDDQKLPSRDLVSALKLLIQQMVTNSSYFKANVPALGSQTSVGSPVGTPGIVGTVKNGSGKYSGAEMQVPETITFLVTRDAQSGGATANQESFSVLGQNSQPDLLAQDWPKGSGSSINLTVVDPSLNNSGGQCLTNGGMDTWTTAAQPPDNFNALVGTRDTDYAKETSTVFASSAAALKVIGGSGTGVSLAQTFNTTATTTTGAGGTPFNIGLYPDQNFIVSYWIKADVVPATGVITVDLVDGSTAVIADDGSTNNTFATTLSGISTSYVQKTGVFRLPAAAPTTIKLRIRASTVVPAGSNIYIDDLAVVRATPLYVGGPSFAIFRGATKPLLNDAWTMATTISASGAFVRGFQRLFNLAALGLQVPTKADGSETVADTLIA